MNIILNIQALPASLSFSFLLIVLLLTLLKIFLYKRFCIYEYLGIAITAIIYFCLKWLIRDLVLVRDIILCVLSTGVLVLSIYDLFNYVSKLNAFHKRTNSLLKNAPFDYYFASDSKDKIFDFNESFVDVTGLEKDEIFGTLGLQTLLAKLQITSINNHMIFSNV